MFYNSPLSYGYPKDIPYEKQSVEVPGTKRPGQTGHYRNAVWGRQEFEAQDLVRTTADVFELALKGNRDLPCLGHRPVLSTNPLKFADHYVWQTYGQVDERRRDIGSALHHYFTKGTVGGGELETIGIWSQNRPEWQIIDMAAGAYRKVSVSLYDTLGKDAVEYCIGHSHLSIVFASAQHVPTLFTLAPNVGVIKMVVSIDDVSSENREILDAWAKVAKVEFMTLAEFEGIGKKHRVDPINAKQDDLTMICYTSGTTGQPKGVMLSQKNIVSAALSVLRGPEFPERGLLISYLPLAHIYERTIEISLLCLGGAIGYFSGDPLRLLEDAQILRPNYFPTVPRVLNRVYQTTMLAGQVSGLKGYIFQKALSAKLDYLHQTGLVTHALWDRLVFNKISQVLGGKILIITTGAAAISEEVADFIKIAFSCEVVEGFYGMTENCGVCTRCFPYDKSASGTIGGPQPCNEIKLVDVPQMGYTSEDKPFPRGEICVRGDNCFSGYYKDEKNTSTTIDEEGWLHTGDVGLLDERMRFKIIDRVKNIMKLAQGEYIALEKVENAYSTSTLIPQIYVHGDPLQSYLVAVVVPDGPQFASLASKNGRSISAEDTKSLVQASQDERIKNVILADMADKARKAGLKGFEHVKKIHITFEPFTVENGLMTPTLKLRRREVALKYKAEIDAMYATPAATDKSSKL